MQCNVCGETINRFPRPNYDILLNTPKMLCLLCATRISSINNRPNKYARVMIELDLISQWSTCQRLWTAAALVDIYGVIKVPARNGTPIGQPHCFDLTSGTERCVYCIHAERNCLNHAARMGVPTEGHNLFALHRPCLSCSNDIVQAGISGVFYRWDYDTDKKKGYVYEMFREKNIHIEQLPFSKAESDFNQMLIEWRQTWTS